MARVDIVIGAVNKAKAVFGEVAMQADTLNKRLQKVSSVFKGLFVGGLVVQFGRKLLEASSYTKELEASSGRIKGAWRGVATDLGDAFARIVLAVEPIITKVGNFFDGLTQKAQYAAAFMTGLATTGSMEEARRIASETVDEIVKEQQARQEAAKVSVDAAADQAEWEKHLANEAEKKVRLEKELAEVKKKAAESEMTTEQLLAERRKELEKARMKASTIIRFNGMDFGENERLEAKIDIVNLEQEIKRLEKEASDALKRAEADADNKRRPGVRVIRFNRDAIDMGRRTENDLRARTEGRMAKLNRADPSWKSADYLKQINDKLNAALALKE